MYVLRESNFNPPQYEAVRHDHGPMLVLAGAGSGKTRVIAHRVAYFISRGIPPETLVAVSFTNKAAAEMRVRVGELVGRERAGRCTLSSFHALGAQILRADIHRLGYRSPFAIFDTTDQKVIIRDILKEMRLDGSRIDGDQILGYISRAKMAFTEPNKLPGMRFNPLRGVVGKLFTRYNKALRAFNAVDFDDLINLPVRLFNEHPDVLAGYHERWHYIMVDEYQDTNHTQFALLQLLARGRGNLVVVGDDDQSIYGFRGADATHILSFGEHFPGAKIVSLEQNYRSTKTILAAANAVIACNTKRHQKVLWTAGEEGELLRHVVCVDEREEAHFVAGEMESLHAEKHIPWRDFAILYRINPQSRSFEEALREYRIPYRMVGGTRFYDRTEVRDVLAYMRVCLNPHDDLAVRRVVNVPTRGLGPSMVGHISALAEQQKSTFFGALKAAPTALEMPNSRVGGRIVELVQVIERYTARFRAKQEKASVLTSQLIADIRYMEHLRSARSSEEMIRRRMDNVEELINGIASFETRHPGKGLGVFLERVALEPPDNRDKDKDEITMMTFHSAKGLEFPHVFMVGVDEGLLPHGRSIKEKGGIDEERRLCYVGITRAKKTLALTSCQTRMRRGEARDTKPSRFLTDIPDETIERDGTSDGTGSPRSVLKDERDRANFAALRAVLFDD